MSEQDHQLQRVKESIGEIVFRFAQERFARKPSFLMRELHDCILSATATAPASPDRILRQLRLDGRIDYRVLNRAESHYEITAVGPTADPLEKEYWRKPEDTERLLF